MPDSDQKTNPGSGDQRESSLIDMSRFELVAKRTKLANHPLRLAILKTLSDYGVRGLSPTEFSKLAGEGLSQSSYHFKVLREQGAIVVKREIPRRGAVEHIYGITSLGREVVALFLPD